MRFYIPPSEFVHMPLYSTVPVGYGQEDDLAKREVAAGLSAAGGMVIGLALGSLVGFVAGVAVAGAYLQED